jgi:hypothetical protein
MEEEQYQEENPTNLSEEPRKKTGEPGSEQQC